MRVNGRQLDSNLVSHILQLQVFDAMQARFDTLRATGGFAPADPTDGAAQAPSVDSGQFA